MRMTTVSLADSPEAKRSKFYFLLRPPELAKHRDAYVRSKNILHKIPLERELIEEDDAGGLSNELLSHLGGTGS